MKDTSSGLVTLAEAALTSGLEEQAESRIAAWQAANPPDPVLLHWRALMLRALDRRAEAIKLLEAASALAPSDPAIAHGLAQVALEAGLPASRLFETALQLNPSNPEIRMGFVSARHAEGAGTEGLELLALTLDGNPGWYAGHRQFAQLANRLGLPARALETLSKVIERFPDVVDPNLVALDLLLSAGEHAAALELADSALARVGEQPALLLIRAVALDELDRNGEARILFDRLGPPADISHAIRWVRHLLRTGRPADALTAIEPWLAGHDSPEIWPYLALTWRLLGDAQADWLEAQAGLTLVADGILGESGLAALAHRLRSLHGVAGRFMNQSVRNGTQTDGPLFARIDPEIIQARTAVSAAVHGHLLGLPAKDEQHPQLALPRNQAPRFSGSWSVRLLDKGFHTSHHHPQGWFSAVLYVASPERTCGTDGYLALGAPPPELGLDLKPYRLVAPVPSRLVVFPSTMWHATLPFDKGERMTIAFDIARPFPET